MSRSLFLTYAALVEFIDKSGHYTAVWYGIASKPAVFLFREVKSVAFRQVFLSVLLILVGTDIFIYGIRINEFFY